MWLPNARIFKERANDVVWIWMSLVLAMADERMSNRDELGKDEQTGEGPTYR